MFDSLFDPKTVAIIGASQDPAKIGNAILVNLIGSGYKGQIIPVNPSSKEILGIPTVPSIDSVTVPPDLVVIALPASKAIDSLKSCIKVGAKFVILIAGGFSETGKEGKQKEDEIRDILKTTKTRLIGPNTLGVYFPYSGVNTALTSKGRMNFPVPGDIGFISQSGALGLLTMDGISEYGVGISAFLNLGNRADLNEIDLLDYLVDYRNTSSICIYLESVPKGKEFFDRVKTISPKKPIVILKSGRTPASAKAASLHTGAMATDDNIINGLISQSGAVRAYDETELIDYGRVLAYSKKMRGDNIAIITTAGGVGVVTSDYVSSRKNGIGLQLAKFTERTKSEIRETIVPFGSSENPIDMTADASVEQFGKLIDVLDRAPEIDAIIAYPLPQTPKMGPEIVDVIYEKIKTGKKPIIVGVLGSKTSKDLLIAFEQRRIPSYPSIQRTVKACLALRKYSKYMMRRFPDEQ